MPSPQKKWPPLFPPNPSVDPNHAWLGSPRSSYLSSARKKRVIIPYCVKRDGQKCLFCLRAVETPEELTVHHVDGTTENNYSDNVQAMHWSCNNSARWGHAPPISQLRTPPPKKTDALLSARENLRDDPTTSRSQLINLDHEVEFRREAFRVVRRMYDTEERDPDKFFVKRDLMSHCMEHSGSSQDASYGYMRRLFAKGNGPLDVIEEGGIRYVGFRNPKDQKLSVEQMEAKYPKEGQAFRQPDS